MLGCGADRPPKPDNLIAQEKMSEIMYDVFILNAAKGINKRILENNGVTPQNFVYKKYAIDSLQFAMSNDYYSYDTKIYEGIMERVSLKIENAKKINDSLIVKEQKTKDSLTSLKVRTKDSLSKGKNLVPTLDTFSPPKQTLKPQVFGQEVE